MNSEFTTQELIKMERNSIKQCLENLDNKFLVSTSGAITKWDSVGTSLEKLLTSAHNLKDLEGGNYTEVI